MPDHNDATSGASGEKAGKNVVELWIQEEHGRRNLRWDGTAGPAVIGRWRVQRSRPARGY
jgi:hypothetical protein